MPGGTLSPKILPAPQWPPKIRTLSVGLFLKVLHRPLTAPLVAKLAPPVAPPNENVCLRPWERLSQGNVERLLHNSYNSANESTEFVEHSIDCKNYVGAEMSMCSVVSLTSLLQKLPLNKTPELEFISAGNLLYADESLCFFSVYCLICVLFTVPYPIPA